MLSYFLVILGAALWATDTLFRHPLVLQITPLTIVLIEHAFAALLTGAWVFIFERKHFFLSWGQNIGALFIGVFGSAVATLLFTMSFSFVNPSVAILIQKLQPIFVILLSIAFLKERANKKFWTWSFIALFAAYFVSFPHRPSLHLLEHSSRIGILLAAGAAWFWAFSTVVGKAVLKKAPSSVLSFWRFFYCFLALCLFARLSQQTQIELPFVMADFSILKSIFLMAGISGFLGVTLYYQGLAKTPASIATILELSFPVCAVIINWKFLNISLSVYQITAAIVLMIAMMGVSFSRD